MQNVFVVNKKEGETPLECLESFRMKKKIGKDVPMTYAGRLDPMASGVMILLAGEECKNKEKYLGLDKEYDFSVLFGFATDTYDILGKITKNTEGSPLYLEKPARNAFSIADAGREIKKNLEFFKGKFRQKYPMYSSKTVAGKQLHEYARSGEEVEAPVREVEVKSLKFLKIRKINSVKLLNDIEKRIAKVNSKNDFRQKEILKLWRTCARKDLAPNYYLVDFHIKCSSGTYVRSISNDLGERLGIPALAYRIKRTKVGKFGNI